MGILRSIFDIKYYAKIHNQPVWKSILYIFVLGLIIYAIWTTSIIFKMDGFLKNNAIDLIESLPEFSIENGELTVNVKQPLKYSGEGNVLILDTTNQTNPKDYSDSKGLLLLGKDNIAIMSNGQVENVEYNEILKVLNTNKLDKEYLINSLPHFIKMVKKIMVVLFIVLFVFWLLFLKVWSILFLSIISLIVNAAQDAKLTYKSLFNICAYAITLPWIFKLIYGMIRYEYRLNWSVYFIAYWTIAILYVVFAVKQIKKNTINPETEQIESI